MKGILFAGDMVRALLNTRVDVWPAKPIDPSLPWKWQTRRVMNPQPSHFHKFADGILRPCADDPTKVGPTCIGEIRNPYGKPGDLLYLKETWRQGTPAFNGPDFDGKLCYRADAPEWPPCKWRSPRFMPRWASRRNLEVKAVRVERVQEIGRDGRKAHDVLAEGVSQAAIQREQEWFYLDDAPAIAFSRLWDSLNAKRGFGWESNPWVWVYELACRGCRSRGQGSQGSEESRGVC